MEFYDPETKLAVKPPRLTRAQETRKAWEDIEAEIREETGIPIVSYGYFDTKNEFVVRLRGKKPQYLRTEFGEMKVMAKGEMEHLVKDFTFKGEGKTGYASRSEMERWQREIIKWAKSLDGRAEIEGKPIAGSSQQFAKANQPRNESVVETKESGGNGTQTAKA